MYRFNGVRMYSTGRTILHKKLQLMIMFMTLLKIIFT
jgi:hypothetical protein